MCDSCLGQPLTFLRQSSSFFRESCSIFCLSPSWAGAPLSAFFAYCCTLSCKLQTAEHHEVKNQFYLQSLPYFKGGNNMRNEMNFISNVSTALFASQPTPASLCIPLLVQQFLQGQDEADPWLLPVHSGQQLLLLVLLGFQLQLLLPESSLDISKLSFQCQHCFLQGSSLQFRVLQLQQKGNKCKLSKLQKSYLKSHHCNSEEVSPSGSASGGPQGLEDQPGIVPGSQFSAASLCFVQIPSGISF